MSMRPYDVTACPICGPIQWVSALAVQAWDVSGVGWAGGGQTGVGGSRGKLAWVVEWVVGVGTWKRKLEWVTRQGKWKGVIWCSGCLEVGGVGLATYHETKPKWARRAGCATEHSQK